MRTLTVAVIVAVASLSSATAQQPTVPATLDFTCHGYDEGATRAYNCIPAAGQESSMPTFVPPVGSTCNGGRIDEFPAGRLVFQIRCQETLAAPSPSAWSRSGTGPNFFTKPIEAVRVRIESSFTGRAGNFIVWCRSPSTSLIVNELIGSAFGNSGTVGIYRMANCQEVEVDTEQSANWTFSQEQSLKAFTPPRSWANVTGAGGGLSADALAALAKATDAERRADQ